MNNDIELLVQESVLVSFSDTPKKEINSMPIHFIPPEKLIYEMAQSFLYNIRYGSHMRMHHPFKLEACFQNSGMGKTYLGQNLLTTINSEQFSTFRSSLEEEYPYEFRRLLDLKYLRVDLTHYYKEFAEVSYKAAFMKILKEEVLKSFHKHPFVSHLEDWFNTFGSLRTLNDLFLGIRHYMNCYLLIHIDEVDQILYGLEPKQLLNAETRAQRYLRFIEEVVSPILEGGFQCFLTGKVCPLDSILRNLYTYQTPPQGVSLKLRYLEPLGEDGVRLLAVKHLGDVERKEEIGKVIYELTGGIAGFVGCGIQFVAERGYNQNTFKEELYKHLLEVAPLQLCPYSKLPYNWRHMYLDLVNTTLMNISLPYEQYLRSKNIWGVPLFQQSSSLTLPDCLSLLPVHVANTGDKYRILFSEIQMYALQRDPAFLLDIQNLSLHVFSMNIKKGSPFINALVDSILLKQMNSQPQPYSNLFPFLKESVLSGITFKPATEKHLFPTIRSAAKDVKESEVDLFFNSTTPNPLELNDKQKSIILNKVKPGILYMNMKVDYASFYKFEDKSYVCWRVYSNDRPFGPLFLKKEIQNSILHNINSPAQHKFILVISAKKISKYFIEADRNTQPHYKTVQHNGRRLAVRIEPGYELILKSRRRSLSIIKGDSERAVENENWIVPVEVVILLEDGLFHLLGQKTYDFVTTDNILDTAAFYLTHPIKEDLLNYPEPSIQSSKYNSWEGEKEDQVKRVFRERRAQQIIYQ
eukprot:TRINITY_DN16157_c0_g1_i1.p1 TRINITY_DN16157_c0_g1~~TRINITY_DN16157_c0_g1_i1.p1  ORF type:complete len:751 (+),score=156.29 TRINITY_DN16157_c0_g1_i1:882-3134(+)